MEDGTLSRRSDPLDRRSSSALVTLRARSSGEPKGDVVGLLLDCLFQTSISSVASPVSASPHAHLLPNQTNLRTVPVIGVARARPVRCIGRAGAEKPQVKSLGQLLRRE